MPVLSVHLACRSWSDLGVVLLEQAGPKIGCEIIRWQDAGRVPFAPPVVELALRLNALCQERHAHVLMLDGSQAWISQYPISAKATQTIPGDARSGTGDGIGTSSNHERFVGYCLALYEALGRLGWQRISARKTHGWIQDAPESGQPPRLLVESYPLSAWKSLGIAPLPARSICRISDLATAYAALTALLPITTSQPPNHGQLQAIVGGLPGLAIEDRVSFGRRFAPSPLGVPDDSWPEGWNAQPRSIESSKSSRPRPPRSADVGFRPT